MKKKPRILKRLLSLLMVTLIAASMMPTLVLAAETTPVIMVGSAKVKPGKSVDVTIDLKDNPGVASLATVVSFPSALTLQSVTYGVAFEEGGNQPESMSSPVSLSWNGQSNVSGNCTFVTLTFLCSESATVGNNCDITLSYSTGDIKNIVEDNIDFQINSGKVNIVKGVPGDITGDFRCDSKDMLRLRKYFAGWNVETDSVALDTNGDGSVNAKDLVRFRKYFAGWNVNIWYDDISCAACIHSFQTVTTKAATCVENGNIAYCYCTKCNKYFNNADDAEEIDLDSTVILATGHTPVTDPAVPATETATGLTEGSHCSKCNAVLVEQQVIPVLTTNIFKVSNAAGAPGDTVTVTLSVGGIVRMNEFDMVLGYDNSVLEVVSIDDELNLSVTSNYSQAKGTIMLNFNRTTDRTTAANIMEITFKIKEGASVGNTEIILNQMKKIDRINDTNDGVTPVDYGFVKGVITVS